MNTTNISITKLRPFEGHPYKVQDDEEMNSLVESIKTNGILTPLIVRPIEGLEEYEVISGHRRLYAATKAGMETVPAFIHPVDRLAAAVELVDSNLHRDRILPSEKAFAYKLKFDALKHQGKTSGQVVPKLTVDAISVTDSGRQVKRYIRLTNLIPPLLNLVDEGRIALSIGVELSYLNEHQQRFVGDYIERDDMTPSYSQAVKLHRASDAGRLGETKMRLILLEPKPNQREQIKIRADKLREVLPYGIEDEDAEDYILKACEHYTHYLELEREVR